MWVVAKEWSDQHKGNFKLKNVGVHLIPRHKSSQETIEDQQAKESQFLDLKQRNHVFVGSAPPFSK